MAISIRKESEVSSEPNVVPLCDVLLVLLIIFMVVTPLIYPGIHVNLPTALNTIDMPENPETVLYIKRDGSLRVNETKTTVDDLQIILEEAFLSARDDKLYLRADQELEYGNIVDIIEIVKLAGVDIVGIITDKKIERVE